MTRLGFLLARLLSDEAGLARLSAPPAALMAELEGRDVALVGNARSLAEGRKGAAIDAAGLVIRLNRAPIPSPVSHGTRTDWLALSVPIGAETLAARAPARVLWMTRKRKRLPYALATRPGFYLNPRADWQDLSARLGAPPSTGLMAIDILARSPAASVTLYGFDFFASLSLSGRRTAAEVPHDFAREAAFVAGLARRDPRFAWG